MQRPSLAAAGLLAMLLTALAGCSDEPLLRDNYWGKSLFEPDAKLGPVRRDEHGDPVLEPEGFDWPRWQPWRHDLTQPR